MKQTLYACVIGGIALGFHISCSASELDFARER